MKPIWPSNHGILAHLPDREVRMIPEYKGVTLCRAQSNIPEFQN